MPTGVCVVKIEEYGFLIDIVLLFVLIYLRVVWLQSLSCFYVGKVFKVDVVYMT